MSKKITRSTVNEQQYSATEFPKSGFPLSYRRYSSYLLGRIHAAGFHWVMPGDKISGKTSGDCTFHRIVTPIMSPVNAMQYNVYIPLRPLDRSFMKGMTPTKLNAMSANWTMPLFNTRYLVQQLLSVFSDNMISEDFSLDNLLYDLYVAIGEDSTTSLSELPTLMESTSTLSTLLYSTTAGSMGLISGLIHNLTTDGTKLCNMADQLYLRDALIDIANNISSKLGSSASPLSGSMLLSDFLRNYLDCVLTPFVGRYSYYAEFKYEYVRPWDLYRISRALAGPQSAAEGTISQIFSNTPQNEYAIRAMYAIWYELFRNVDLEPEGVLPDWREFSSTSIFDMSAGGNLLYLIYRIRSWEKDMFISAQIDDISRHVYAPIMAFSDAKVASHNSSINNNDTNVDSFDGEHPGVYGHSKPSLYTLAYVDQNNPSTPIQIECPVPSNVNDVISSIDKTFNDVYGLDLDTLKQSQMLARYLKRNYLFGDLYQDRMLAHYNSRVSDMRINRPEVLSQSMDGYNMGQEVSNVSTDETKVGDRTATATVKVTGEQYTTYCEEFGILVSLVCFMPRAMYDGSCPQNYLSKQIDLPLPEFAANNEEFGRKLEIAGTGLYQGYDSDSQDNRFMFGRYPAYHAWRSRVDEVGGEFLDELQDSTFRRFFGMFSDDTTPKLNYFFIHCRPNLNMFANNVLYDAQLYGDLVHECFVERVLPTPVETI